jgi:hypothetical protein
MRSIKVVTGDGEAAANIGDALEALGVPTGQPK